MLASFFKHSLLTLTIILLTLVISWRFPSIRWAFMVILLLFGSLRALAEVVTKQRTAYQQGEITLPICLRNLGVEIVGLFSAMLLAGWSGRSLAQLATNPIQNEGIKLVAGMVVGLLAGVGIGFFIKQTWGRLVKAPTEN